MLVNAALSALLNVVTLAGAPFFLYWLYHWLWHRRRIGEVAARAGLVVGERRYLAWCLAASVATVAALAIWPPPLEAQLREGSAFRAFAGLGLSGSAVAMALLYGVVKTGFAEEFLFRGLIAGSLGRRLPTGWANLLQALIFLAPHLLILVTMPEMWLAIPFVLAGALFTGWVRLESGSLLGPWLLHAAVNVTTALSVAVRSAP
ncbi:MAG TPA: CPBP family intramembrane glutamic endopeptidase [Vicinamibacterales bacterium]|nr:CPBP family intramembrane glutamic endopeptidase [Vicinamibacterales bacterium]